MSASVKSDLVMMFTDKSGSPVWAESMLDVLKGDKFMLGFDPVTEYDDYSSFFEVTSFNFTLMLKPDDKAVGSLSQPGQGAGNIAPAAQDQFSRWRSAKADEYKKIRFPLEFDTFSFDRVIDGASPIFFNACCNQESFQSAALVKRVAVGQGDSVRHTMGFLRLDFRDVLMTGISWNDGDLVTENCTFICKAMKVRYRAQNPDGDLQQPSEANWDQKKDGGANSGGGR